MLAELQRIGGGGRRWVEGIGRKSLNGKANPSLNDSHLGHAQLRFRGLAALGDIPPPHCSHPCVYRLAFQSARIITIKIYEKLVEIDEIL